MKNIPFCKVILVSILIGLTNITNAQWTQIGTDIDGENDMDRAGTSLRINSNGFIVAISSPWNDDNGSSSGQVNVFEYSGENWIQMGSDINGDAVGDHFGCSVCLNSDGNIVAIGAEYNDINGTSSGHAKVYKYSGAHWIQMGSDLVGESTYDFFGNSISLNSDGSILAVGAPGNDGNGTSSGQVKLYEYNGSNWIQKGNCIYGESSYDRFGNAVSLSSDGSIVAVGAFYNEGNGYSSGQVRVLEYLGGSWIQLGNDIDGEASEDESGNSVSLSSDGTIVAIGAWLNDGNGNLAGQARVFEYSGGNWIQKGSDIDGEAIGDMLGYSVQLSSDGSIIAVGADECDGNGVDAGQVKIFEYSGGNWVQIGDNIDGENAHERSGYSVSLSSEGSFVAIGSPDYQTGHARVYYDCNINSNILNLTLTKCDSYTSPSGSHIWTISGIYNDTIHVASGCDIIANIDLTINNSTSTTTIIDTTTCDDYISPSGNYIWNTTGTYIDVLPNSVGCDSTIIINLSSSTNSTIYTTVCDFYVSPSGNYTWSNSGIYHDTITNSIGCDSILTVYLTGTTSSSIIIVECDSDSCISPSGNYIWTVAGIYQDTIQNIAGCDSIITIDLAFSIDTTITFDWYYLFANEINATYQWVDCDNSYSIVGYDQMFSPTYNGNFAVIITKGGCIDTSYCYFHIAIGVIEHSSNNEVKIYPNPTTGKITVQGEGIERIEVLNIEGQCVIKYSRERENLYNFTSDKNMVDINLTQYSKGIYFVKVITNNGINVQKIVVE